MSTFRKESRQVPFGQGVMEQQQWHLDGLRISHTLTRFEGPAELRASNDHDAVRLHFGLRGGYRAEYPQLKQTWELEGGHHNLMYSNGLDLVVENLSPEVETFGIDFERSLFMELAERGGGPLAQFGKRLSRGSGAMLVPQWSRLNPAILRLIDEITHCPCPGNAEPLFLYAKALELLSVQVDSLLSQPEKPREVIRTRSDRHKIEAARALVLRRMQDPPSLPEIAKTVGLNEFKLKKGFREVYGNTVFGFLAEARLQLARNQLKEPGRTARQIAFELGYSSAQHFNTAFKKRFGLPPKEWAGK